MILFKKDWDRYPSAIVHTTTKNESFIRISALYKEMGIENHLFPLALHDKSLMDIDPHSKDLDRITVAKIVRECRVNPWYFFREVLRVPQTGSIHGVPFIANRYNIAIIWLYFNHISTLGITIRQKGKSLTAICINAGLLTVWTMNDTMSLITKDNGLRVKTVKNLKEVLELLPFYLQHRTKADTYNTEAISIDLLGNKFVSNVAQSSIAGAMKVGIGNTSANFWIDELAFINNVDVTIQAALPGTGAARDNARKNGTPYGTMYTTTAGYLNTKSGVYAKEMYDTSAKFTEKLYDSEDISRLEKIIRKSSKDHTLLVTVEFNHRQLGETDEWLKEKIEASRQTGDAIRANYFNQWITGNSTSPIPKNIIEVIKESIEKEPNIVISSGGYMTRWYVSDREIEMYKQLPIVIGSDTSDAIGRDGITMVFRDIRDGSVLACMECNETNTLDFADYVIEILTEFMKSVLIMERKLNGGTIIDHMLRILPTLGIDPFRRIFNFVVQDMDIEEKYRDMLNTPMERRDGNVYIQYRKQFGYPTSGGGRTSRDNLYGSNLINSCKYTGSKVRDSVLANQLFGLIVKNGRIDHSSGNHDDMVIAWLLGYYFLTKANNVGYYGIESRDILSNVQTTLNIKDIEKLKQIKRQEQIKARISTLLKMISETRDVYKSKMLINKVKMLERGLDGEIKNKFNLEARLQEIETMKKLKKKRRW